MTRRRWIADEVSGNRAALTGAHAEHLARVLRAKVGQEFDIIAFGVARHGRIVSVEDGRVEFDLGEDIPSAVSANVNVLISIFKFDRMEWAIEKCTELGVSRIVPLIAQRTEAHLAAAAVKRVERWQRIARQASEQSRRASVPELPSPLKLNQALDSIIGTRILLSELEQESRLADLVPADLDPGGITLAFGPEGGWTESELLRFRECGWQAATLGNTILRAETAIIAAVAVLMSQL